MKKSLYSLMLSEDVVQEVDALAHRLGTNRSALVNRILADYVSVTTPEGRIEDIFRTIEALVMPGRQLVPMFAPNSPTMSLKSSLAYKYRPTVKYDVELSRRADSDVLGTLSVLYRTQSAELIAALTEFFRLWAQIEDAHLAPRLGAQLACTLTDSRFLRPIALPHRSCTADEIARAITDYVQLFDRLLKGWLSGEYSSREVERLYCEDLRHRELLI